MKGALDPESIYKLCYLFDPHLLQLSNGNNPAALFLIILRLFSPVILWQEAAVLQDSQSQHSPLKELSRLVLERTFRSVATFNEQEKTLCSRIIHLFLLKCLPNTNIQSTMLRTGGETKDNHLLPL